MENMYDTSMKKLLYYYWYNLKKVKNILLLGSKTYTI